MIEEILPGLATSASGMLPLGEQQLIDLTSGNTPLSSSLYDLVRDQIDTASLSFVCPFCRSGQGTQLTYRVSKGAIDASINSIFNKGGFLNKVSFYPRLFFVQQRPMLTINGEPSINKML